MSDPTNPPPSGGHGNVWLDAIDYAKKRGGSHALLVVMEERRRLGLERYGSHLRYENGRSAKLDLQEELLDAYAYATQCNMPPVCDVLLDLIYLTLK